MSPPTVPSDDEQPPGHYAIRIQGHLDACWSEWFDGLRITSDHDGTTVIAGPVADQAALHGLIRKVRDLGLPLISVGRAGADQPAAPAIETE